MFDEAVRLVGEDYTGIQQIFGIEDFLQFLHRIIGFLAPFVFDERCHIAASAMFCLQRAIIFLNDEFGHLVHHLCISLHLLLLIEALVEDEVIISFESMSIDTAIAITEVCDNLLKFHSGFGQIIDWEGNVLDEARCSNGTHSTNSREDTRTDGPILAINLRILSKLSRDIQLELAQSLLDGVDLELQVLMGHGLRLGQNGSEIVVITWLDTFNLAGINILLVLQIDGIIDRSQRQVIEHLGTLDHQVLGTHLDIVVRRFQFLQSDNTFATFLHGHEINHSRSTIRIFVEGTHSHTSNECKCSFGSYHRVSNDVEWVVVGYQWTNIQARHILDTVFLLDAFSELGVCTHLVAQVLDLLEEFGMRLAECFATLFVTRVKNCTISQYHLRGDEHTIGVRVHAAVHA